MNEIDMLRQELNIKVIPVFEFSQESTGKIRTTIFKKLLLIGIALSYIKERRLKVLLEKRKHQRRLERRKMRRNLDLLYLELAIHDLEETRFLAKLFGISARQMRDYLIVLYLIGELVFDVW